MNLANKIFASDDLHASIIWRIHVLAWAVEHCKHLKGDMIEFGCYDAKVAEFLVEYSELEQTDKLNPKVRQSVKDHRQRMKDLTEGKVIGSDGKPIKVPSKEAADYVQKSWSTMALGFHEGSPGMADAMMKNLAEMAEYQRELAQGDEVYLPSSGVFPSGDKLLVTRDGEGKAVNISSVSIKYGKKGKYKAYGQSV